MDILVKEIVLNVLGIKFIIHVNNYVMNYNLAVINVKENVDSHVLNVKKYVILNVNVEKLFARKNVMKFVIHVMKILI